MHSSLRIVQLNSPFENRGNPEVWGFFSKLVAQRRLGYGAEYPPDVIPVGLDDLYATHHIVCREQGSELTPLVAYKEVSLDASRKHGFKFSPLALVDKPGGERHKASIEEIMNRCIRTGEALNYLGTLTIDPETRQNRELVTTLWEIITSIIVHRETDTEVHHMLSLGNVRFKMHRFFYRLGCHDLEWNGKSLDPIGMSFAHDELVKLYYRNTGFPEETIKLAMQYRALWEARYTIGNDIAKIQPIAAKKAA